MEDLFHSYWWLLFPLGWIGYGAFTSWLNYRRQREAIQVIKSYADKGQEPPQALLDLLERPIDSEKDFWGYGGAGGGSAGHTSGGDRGMWFSVVLFGVMASGFAYASHADLYGAGEAFLIVTIVMGALFLACLVSALLGQRRSPK